MAYIDLPELNDKHGNTLDDVFRAFALSPTFAEAISGMSSSVYGDIALTMREREAARMRIAIENECALCLGIRFPSLLEQGVTEQLYAAISDWRNSDELSEREQLVVEYTELYLTNHTAMDAAFFARINAEFTPRETFELTAIVGALMANGRMMKVLGLDTHCSLSGDDIQGKLS